MSRDQVFTVIILVCLIGLFLWDRLRYDLVALLALLAAVAAGVVPSDKAFNGFANPVLPLIGAALIVSVAIGQSGAIEVLLRWLNPLLRSKDLQVGVLVACVTVLSAFMKNIGALAIFISAALQVARRNKRLPSEFLMPLSFASLLGGSMTLIGTSPNLLASAVRQELTGAPFGMFDFTPVGAGLALIGALFLAVGWRLLPHRRGAASGTSFTIEDYTSEVRIPERSPFVGRTVGEVEKLSSDISIAALIRGDGRRQIPTRRWKLHPGDVLVVETDPQALEQFARDGNLQLVGTEKPPRQAPANAPAGISKPAAERDAARSDRPPPDDRPLGIVEAVIASGSELMVSRRRRCICANATASMCWPSVGAASCSARGCETRDSSLATPSSCRAIPANCPKSSWPSAVCRLPSARSISGASGACCCRLPSSRRRLRSARSSWCRRRSLLSAPQWRWCCSAW